MPGAKKRGTNGKARSIAKKPVLNYNGVQTGTAQCNLNENNKNFREYEENTLSLLASNRRAFVGKAL